ncbi:hypothetical protein ACFWCB_06025 [Streptomyces sp. NPDC060048]|uniref:hypothetical protein n=1 Tax=unclassified Streptomyces TaxID=2593676 RepID=UPI003695DEB7
MSESMPNAKGPAPVRLAPEATKPVLARGTVVTPLPEECFVGVSYPVVFSFTNNGRSAVGGVTITKNFPPEFTQTMDACGGPLIPGATCTVEGDLVPAQEAAYTVGLTFSYTGGAAVTLSTSTRAVRASGGSAF